jgi:hypothetical protein
MKYVTTSPSLWQFSLTIAGSSMATLQRILCPRLHSLSVYFECLQITIGPLIQTQFNHKTWELLGSRQQLLGFDFYLKGTKVAKGERTT